MTQPSDTGDYAVGYKNPPKETRFKPGVTGKSPGRPRKNAEPDLVFATDSDEALLRDASSKITIMEGGRRLRMTKAEALSKKLINAGLKGEAVPGLKILQAIRLAEQRQGNLGKTIVEEAIKLRGEWAAYICRLSDQNARPDLGFNPADFVIDSARNTIAIKGSKKKPGEIAALVYAGLIALERLVAEHRLAHVINSNDSHSAAKTYFKMIGDRQ